MSHDGPGLPPTTSLDLALDATDVLIAGVRNDQWSNPTPCADWNVRTLVSHLVVGNRAFADILYSDLSSLGKFQQIRNLDSCDDQLGADPVGAYREAGAALRTAFNQPGVIERVFESPIGFIPGGVLLHLRVTEILVHGWDLARATGQPVNVPDELAEDNAFSRSQLTADVPRTGRFGPAQHVADEAAPIDRLAAFLGRPIDDGLTGVDRG